MLDFLRQWIAVNDEFAEGFFDLGAIDRTVLSGDGDEVVVFPKRAIEWGIIDGDDPAGFQVFYFGGELVHLDLGPAAVVFHFGIEVRRIQEYEISGVVVELEDAAVVQVFNDDSVEAFGENLEVGNEALFADDGG